MKRRSINRIHGFILTIAACVFLFVSSSSVRADPIPSGGHSEHVKVIGFSGLGGRYGAFKMALNRAASGRWYLYMGHSFDLGWSILDITNPGIWMAHCHIAEHHESGMMFSFQVDPVEAARTR